MTTMNGRRHPGGSVRRGSAGIEMGPNFHRIRKATLESPLILLYAAVIVTVITLLYWLLGG